VEALKLPKTKGEQEASRGSLSTVGWGGPEGEKGKDGFASATRMAKGRFDDKRWRERKLPISVGGLRDRGSQNLSKARI